MERFDYFIPPNSTKIAKLVIWFHGGYWGNVRASTKENNCFVAKGPLKSYNGTCFHFASVEYPYCGPGAVNVVPNSDGGPPTFKSVPNSGGASLTKIVDSAYKAVEKISEFAEKHFNIKPDNIVVGGHSAGGHLAAMIVLNSFNKRK